MTAATAQAATAGAAGPRQGPRPLPQQLALAALIWSSSRSAWPLSRNGSLPWNPELRGRAAALHESLASVPSDDFAAALDAAIGDRGLQLLQAIERYRDHPYRRDLPEPPCLWQAGGSRLLDYGRAEDPPLLVVPSLINRNTVLDLSERRSLVRWLAGQGLRPLMIDWGSPEGEERGYTLTDYVAGRLEAALDAVLAVCGRPPLLAGYCMGGLLALALSLRRRRDLSAMALLATPWDFHAAGPVYGEIGRVSLLTYGPLIDLIGVLPVDAIQSLFALVDPAGGLRKFLAFGRMHPDSERAADFVALEDWLNDGVPLAGPVARECLDGWYGANSPHRGRWRIAGRAVEAQAVELPVLNLVPAQDRIVPPESALALSDAVPRIETWRPAVGHIGMVVSQGAPDKVWRPLAAWLRERAK